MSLPAVRDDPSGERVNEKNDTVERLEDDGNGVTRGVSALRLVKGVSDDTTCFDAEVKWEGSRVKVKSVEDRDAEADVAEEEDDENSPPGEWEKYPSSSEEELEPSD